MTELATAAPRTAPRSWRRTAVRWLVGFAGFPLGGLAAELLTGPVDGPLPAVAGGLITGAVLGTVQAWALGRFGPGYRAWVAATALGLGAGLGAGAAVVGYRSDLTSLAVQGAICGLAVGAAQAVTLRSRLGRTAWGWPLLLAAVWALGWTITTSIGVNVEDGWTVFGSSGAVTVTVVTLVLPWLLLRRNGTQS